MDIFEQLRSGFILFVTLSQALLIVVVPLLVVRIYYRIRDIDKKLDRVIEAQKKYDKFKSKL
ncbi:MAG: hypothetical protein C0463_06640 [Idiomarina sp.]|uniref:Uncharacterized protein n=1 Tax=Aliidiomarina maris TaxID=531312 RepID=A0A327WN37_9GAMM|nr:hypothetical protein [Idiomarina sp.]RAJ93289.1 hypothetical protein B0I24_12016 [Aliidiomarina maris]RUO18545.1 hypothetical protein CWE07_13680 [Aliidiomarina maris]